MNTILKYLILPVAVVVFAYYYTMEKPDIRYSLSERIPIKLTEAGASENIQQLEIRNVGSSEAKRIQVTINGKIISYDLLKYSKADIVDEFHSDTSTEIVYPVLPPEGSFRLLIRSSGNGINKSDLSINYGRGKGKEAFAESNSYASLIIAALFLFYILMTLESIRSYYIDRLESKARYDSESILKQKKPLYLNADKWKSIRKEAQEKKLESDKTLNRYADIKNSSSYVFLNSAKPEYLTDEEWYSIFKKAKDAVSTMMIYACIRNWGSADILNSMNIVRPIHFDEGDWVKLINDVSGFLLTVLKTESNYDSAISLLSKIRGDRPNQVPEKIWSEYLKYLKDEYSKIVSRELENDASPMQFLERQQLDVLSKDKVEILKKRAYRLELSKFATVEPSKLMESEKPKWMEETDYKSLLAKAKETIDLGILTQKHKSVLDLLNCILYSRTLRTTKPETLNDDEWQEILKLDSQFMARKADRESIARDKESVSILKDKIERQLEIINNLLSDPSSLDKIEEYSNAFSPGNFENLKQLSKRMKADY